MLYALVAGITWCMCADTIQRLDLFVATSIIDEKQTLATMQSMMHGQLSEADRRVVTMLRLSHVIPPPITNIPVIKTIIEKDLTECPSVLLERIEKIIPALYPATQSDRAAEIVEALHNKDLIQIEQDMINSNAVPSSMEQNARDVYELIDDLLARYIDLERGINDISGDAIALIREQYTLMEILADQFKLFSFIGKLWQKRPLVRTVAYTFLQDAFDTLSVFVKDPRENIGLIVFFENLVNPLGKLVNNATIKSTQLVEPLAQFARAWEWYQAVGGSSLSVNVRVWNAAWWQEAARKAQDAVRTQEAKVATVGFEQDVWNKIAQFDLRAALQAQMNYNASKPKIKNHMIEMSVQQLQKDTTRMEQVKKTFDINVIRAELTNPDFKKLVDSYARREELFTLAPAQAYSYEARKGAQKIYAYVDMLLARLISLLGATSTSNDLAIMETTYQYLTNMNETYGMNKGWFTKILGAETAQAQARAADKLNDDVLVAYNLINATSPDPQEMQTALDRLTISIQQYESVGGQPNTFVTKTVLPRLKKRIGKK
jgi:hypothetical protein